MKRREYPDYDAYLSHQVSKTADPRVRRKVEANWQRDWGLFIKAFDGLRKIFPPVAAGGWEQFQGLQALCLGARLGCEVAALQSMGLEAIGVDLVENPPPVVKGDFHDLPFPDSQFGFVFSNAVDHVFDLDQFAAEVLRVCRPEAVLLWHIAVKHIRRHEAVWIESVEEVTRRFPGFEVVADDPWEGPVRAVWMRRAV